MNEYDSVGEPIGRYAYCYKCGKRGNMIEYNGYYYCEKCLKELLKEVQGNSQQKSSRLDYVTENEVSVLSTHSAELTNDTY